MRRAFRLPRKSMWPRERHKLLSNCNSCHNCHEVDCLNEGFGCSIYSHPIARLECHKAIEVLLKEMRCYRALLVLRSPRTFLDSFRVARDPGTIAEVTVGCGMNKLAGAP
jgi:hypothetical protein